MYKYLLYLQKQSSRGVPMKMCSENVQQFYKRTPIPKCNFNKIALQLYYTWYGCSTINLLHIFRTPFPKNTSGKLLLYLVVIHRSVCRTIEISRRQDTVKHDDTFAKTKSSRPEVFRKKGVLRNFAKFTGKHLCQSFFFNKVSSLCCRKILIQFCFNGDIYYF